MLCQRSDGGASVIIRFNIVLCRAGVDRRLSPLLARARMIFEYIQIGKQHLNGVYGKGGVFLERPILLLENVYEIIGKYARFPIKIVVPEKILGIIRIKNEPKILPRVAL